MAEFSLDRFKYRWRGDWAGSVSYRRDDIVRVNGKSYVCLIAHTSDSAFRNDLNAILPGSSPPQLQPRWVVMTSGRSFLGNWSTSIDYNLGDVVFLNGYLWLCVQSHASSTFEIDQNNWTIFAAHLEYINNWTQGTEYTPGAVAKYNGIVYKCINSHTAITTLEENISDWEIFHNGIEYRGAWNLSTEYRKNDLVKYGGSIFKCNTTHTSGVELIDAEYFDVELPGFQFDGIWDSTTEYNSGDVVRYGGNIYFAVDNNLNERPYSNTTYWILLAESFNFKGQWTIDTEYKIGDLVLRGGELYKAVRDINIENFDESSATYLEPDVWELLVPGKIWSQNWSTETNYSVGQTVNYLGTLYVCNFEHISSDQNFPGDNGSGYVYWDILVQAGQPGGMLYKGDLLTYDLNRTLAGDGSTLGPARVGIGTYNQKLSIRPNSETEELEVYWRDIANDAEVIYVTNNGSDVNGDGTLYSPFASVRHACEYVEDNFDPLTPTKVAVSTGRFEEIGPIVIPAGCVVMGDELRSTTIVANQPKTSYSNDLSYTIAYLNYFTSIITNILTNVPITDGYTGGTGQVIDLPASGQSAANILGLNIIDFINFSEFRISSGITDPTVTGSNTLTESADNLNAVAILNANKLFIYNEIFGYLEATYPAVTFNREKTQLDVYALLRGLNNDLLYAGNYYTIQSARRYANATLGSQLDDLFYCRDTTGLRNCTVDGLQGTLNPPGVFSQFQRPTGGAYCSLDPGWGPADERTWITNRSPYIQGVTTLGTAAIGKKVDGSLHNGGNKSMVSNDFTQVISDGIGAWVLNNGRAELVSVFTYYAQVGYLAEDGGIIRATNGNNSYGTFGSIAEGTDPLETPQSVSVWNRNNQAQVLEAFAGGTNDKIFTFEYGHCGENYTTASAEIIGAGADASVNYTDFRDGGMYEARLINTQGSGSEGGSNYLVRQNSAQNTSGAQTRIILNTNEVTQFESEIIGMRILIVSGDGAGQYAVVDGFDSVTKVCDVIKESDGTPGWDHVIPGTPIESALDSTAVYRIEPKLTVNHPGFTSTATDLPSVRTYGDVIFGGITETFNNIQLDTGTGETFDGSAINAVVTVVQNSGEYTVTITNPGAGYAVNDSVTVLGTSLGGATPDNDLILTVTEVSDDSTNSIQNLSQSGTGRQGRLVAVANPNYAQYSDDGQTWQETNTSFNGPFRKILNGNGKFIAIPENDNKISYSATGESWTTRSLPLTEEWVDGAFGDGRFVILANSPTGNAVVYSDNGLSWSASVLPTGSDSTVDEYQAIAHGAGKFVAITGSQTKDVAVSSNGVSWSLQAGVLPAGDIEWAGMAYGNNRFLALATDGSTAYSLDHGTTWYAGTTAPNTGGANLTWKDIKFSQGVFFVTAVDGGGGSTYAATTENGLYWYERTLSTSGTYKTLTFANINNIGKWYLLGDTQTTNGVSAVSTGAQAKVRADIFAGSFQNIKIWDPGSGYTDSNLPVITVVDNQYIVEVETDNRIGNGVLSQPDFVNRGNGYRTSTSSITITGDGYADIIPEENTLVLKGVTTVPGPGVQIRITGILDETTEDPTDLLLFTGVSVTDLGPDDSGTGSRLVQFTVSPSLKNEYNLEHATSATLRLNYSQCRISGHDFLDIGTGNFVDTNYPELYAGGNFFVAAPENEVLEVNGGRVFYVSTDQDGNFRAGELFGVDQATGIVTISAEFFDLDGLSELSLGGVRLGGSGTVVNEFSTDPTFSADSNNIIPTQRAIATFLADRLSVGGSDLETNKIVAGTVSVGGENDEIEIVGDGYLQIPVDVDFFAYDDNANAGNIQGTIISQMLYFRNFNDTIQ